MGKGSGRGREAPFEDHISCRCFIDHTIIQAAGDIVQVEPDTRGAVGLRIGIHQQRFIFQYCKTGRQVDGGSRFPLLLIGHANGSLP